jgi:hypothetical protein
MGSKSRVSETDAVATAANRREFPRVSSTCIVDYRTITDDPRLQAMKSVPSGHLQNISGGGVRVRLPENPGSDQLLALNIHLPAFPTSVIAMGKVKWSEPADDGFDVGIEFWWVGWQDAGAQEEIRRYITSRLDTGEALPDPTAG